MAEELKIVLAEDIRDEFSCASVCGSEIDEGRILFHAHTVTVEEIAKLLFESQIGAQAALSAYAAEMMKATWKGATKCFKEYYYAQARAIFKYLEGNK
jgi:hypothetical protein